MAEETKKIKVLWLSDLMCATGFAQVAQNILKRLLATGKYEVTAIGINHHGEPFDYAQWPIKLYPARMLSKAVNDQRYADLFGRQRLLDEIGTGEYDLVFTLQDGFILESVAPLIVETRRQLIRKGKKPFRWIYYFPVDNSLLENWVKNSIAMADFPVAYTNYGKEQVEKYENRIDVDVIYHGIDTEVFKPMPHDDIEAFKAEYFQNFAKGKFIVTNINRNQRRKDIPRTLAAFARFHKMRPDSILYLHMRHNDVGGDVKEMARHMGLGLGKDYLLPVGFDENQGYPVSVVNALYNASDVVISTTLGEGWGLSSTEAMATKTPVIFPDNTSLREILAEGRGLLVPSGKTETDWVCLGAEDMNQFRPVTDVESMANALCEVYDNREKYQKNADKAYEWVKKTISWDHVFKQWQQVFDKAYESLSVDFKDVGRNDTCPMCPYLKFKRCWRHNPEVQLPEVAPSA